MKILSLPQFIKPKELCILVCAILMHVGAMAQNCMQINVPTESSLTSVYFVNNFMGWAVGTNGTVLSTENGGKIWNHQTSGTDHQLNDVYFSNASKGIIVGNNGIILKTVDGGVSWQKIKTDETNCLFAVDSKDQQSFWVVGETGVILNSVNEGSSWTKVDQGLTKSNLYDLAITEANQIIAVGENNVVLSHNDKEHFRINSNPHPKANTSIDLKNDKVLLTSTQGLSRNNVIQLFDGEFDQLENGSIRKIIAGPKEKSIMVGSVGMVKIQDGASEWLELNCSTKMGLNDVTFSDDNTAWVVGNKGTLLKINLENEFSEEEFSTIVYPNPTLGELIVKSNIPDYSLKIINNLGQVIHAENSIGSSSFNYDLSAFPSGMYMIQIEGEDYKYSQKVILISE